MPGPVGQVCAETRDIGKVFLRHAVSCGAIGDLDAFDTFGHICEFEGGRIHLASDAFSLYFGMEGVGKRAEGGPEVARNFAWRFPHASPERTTSKNSITCVATKSCNI